jgi:hypothetical protein
MLVYVSINDLNPRQVFVVSRVAGHSGGAKD